MYTQGHTIYVTANRQQTQAFSQKGFIEKKIKHHIFRAAFRREWEIDDCQWTINSCGTALPPPMGVRPVRTPGGEGFFVYHPVTNRVTPAVAVYRQGSRLALSAATGRPSQSPAVTALPEGEPSGGRCILVHLLPLGRLFAQGRSGKASPSGEAGKNL